MREFVVCVPEIYIRRVIIRGEDEADAEIKAIRLYQSGGERKFEIFYQGFWTRGMYVDGHGVPPRKIPREEVGRAPQDIPPEARESHPSPRNDRPEGAFGTPWVDPRQEVANNREGRSNGSDRGIAT